MKKLDKELDDKLDEILMTFTNDLDETDNAPSGVMVKSIVDSAYAEARDAIQSLLVEARIEELKTLYAHRHRDEPTPLAESYDSLIKDRLAKLREDKDG